MSEKVYCVNCKHWSRNRNVHFWDYAGDDCTSLNGLPMADTPSRREPTVKIGSRHFYKNRKNDCQEYEYWDAVAEEQKWLESATRMLHFEKITPIPKKKMQDDVKAALWVLVAVGLFLAILFFSR